MMGDITLLSIKNHNIHSCEFYVIREKRITLEKHKNPQPFWQILKTESKMGISYEQNTAYAGQYEEA